jgi:prefoldin subunit 2
MQPLDSDRRAFRMVGGVLVERTVGEVLPVVTDNRKKVSTLCVVLKLI